MPFRSRSMQRHFSALGLALLVGTPLGIAAQDDVPPGTPVNPWTEAPPSAPEADWEPMPVPVAAGTPSSPWVDAAEDAIVDLDRAEKKGGFFRGPLQYGKDRFNDVVDIFRLRVGVPRTGRGYGAKARVTTLAQAGYVRYDGHYLGIDRRAAGLFDEDRLEGGASVIYGSRQEMQGPWGNEFLRGDTEWSKVEDRRILRNIPHWDDGRQRYLSVGAEVATPLLAVDAGVYPEEALDFVLGIFLIDIYTDDQLFQDSRPGPRFRRPATLPGPDLEASTARKRAEMDALYGGMVADEAADREAKTLEGFSEEAQQKFRDRQERGNSAKPLKVLDPIPLEQLEQEIEVTPDAPTPSVPPPMQEEPGVEP